MRLTKFFTSLLIGTLSSLGALHSAEAPYTGYIGHTEGGWLGISEGYTSASIFSALPFSENPAMNYFSEIKCHVFNNGKVATNVGIGLRYQKAALANILGINFFYDYTNGCWNHNFHQVGIGLEYLTPRFNIRFNSYLPIGAQTPSRTCRFDYENGYRGSLQSQKTSYRGFDAEAGFWLKTPSAERSFDLYAALGGYYYPAKKGFKQTGGPTARIAARFLRYFSFEIRGGYDSIQHGMAQGTLTAAIPLDALFNGSSAPNNENMLYMPVARLPIIAISKKQCHLVWEGDFPLPSCDDP